MVKSILIPDMNLAAFVNKSVDEVLQKIRKLNAKPDPVMQVREGASAAISIGGMYAHVKNSAFQVGEATGSSFFSITGNGRVLASENGSHIEISFRCGIASSRFPLFVLFSAIISSVALAIAVYLVEIPYGAILCVFPLVIGALWLLAIAHKIKFFLDELSKPFGELEWQSMLRN